MRLLVGVVTRRRQKLLEFMLRYMHLDLKQEVRGATEIHVFENDTEARSLEVLRGVSTDIRPIGYSLLPDERPRESIADRNADLGVARREIINEFMKHPQFTHCVILDDDIVVSLNTIWQGAKDLELLKDFGIATLTMHPFPKRIGSCRYTCGDHIFANHDFSGDNAWIIPKETIQRFGNLFGPHDGGYANTTWAAIKNAGLTNVTRYSPAYDIQHVGVEGLAGTTIYRDQEKKPGWAMELFKDYVSKRTLHSEIAMLWSSAGADELLDFVRRETIVRNHKQCTEGVRDQVLMPKGKVEILCENAKTGEIENRISVDNLVVNNAKSIMAHLLGSASSDDWAIKRMVFGSGSTPPTESDVSLEVPITPEKTVTSDYPDDSSVRFTGVLESDEANGFPINEAALYSGSEGIFSRIVFGPLNKSSDFRFVFRWTIYW